MNVPDSGPKDSSSLQVLESRSIEVRVELIGNRFKRLESGLASIRLELAPKPTSEQQYKYAEANVEYSDNRWKFTMKLHRPCRHHSQSKMPDSCILGTLFWQLMWVVPATFIRTPCSES